MARRLSLTVFACAFATLTSCLDKVLSAKAYDDDATLWQPWHHRSTHRVYPTADVAARPNPKVEQAFRRSSFRVVNTTLSASSTTDDNNDPTARWYYALAFQEESSSTKKNKEDNDNKQQRHIGSHPPFCIRAVKNVNNGGYDDGVDGREADLCRNASKNHLCAGDSLSFAPSLGVAPYFVAMKREIGRLLSECNRVLGKQRHKSADGLGIQCGRRMDGTLGTTNSTYKLFVHTPTPARVDVEPTRKWVDAKRLLRRDVGK